MPLRKVYVASTGRELWLMIRYREEPSQESNNDSEPGEYCRSFHPPLTPGILFRQPLFNCP